MTVELLTSLSTDASQRGDRFQARVTEPREFERTGQVVVQVHPQRAIRAVHLRAL